MTKEQKDNLFVLIKSLSKSEKRQFKLYVGRLGVNEDSKFLLLFKILKELKLFKTTSVKMNPRSWNCCESDTIQMECHLCLQFLNHNLRVFFKKRDIS